MKINSGNSGSVNPVDLASAKSKKSEAERASKSNSSEASDRVSAELSKTLNQVTEAIGYSGLTAGDVHSNVDVERVNQVLSSIDRVDAKQPRLPDAELIDIAEDLADRMTDDIGAALQAFNTPNPSRVAELLA